MHQARRIRGEVQQLKHIAPGHNTYDSGLRERSADFDRALLGLRRYPCEDPIRRVAGIFAEMRASLAVAPPGGQPVCRTAALG